LPPDPPGGPVEFHPPPPPPAFARHWTDPLHVSVESLPVVIDGPPAPIATSIEEPIVLGDVV
jgi:hypothetical protein